MVSVLLLYLLAFVAIASQVDGVSRNYFLVDRTGGYLGDESAFQLRNGARSPLPHFLMRDHLFPIADDDQTMEYFLPARAYDSFLTARVIPKPMPQKPKLYWYCQNNLNGERNDMTYRKLENCELDCPSVFPGQAYCYTPRPFFKCTNLATKETYSGIFYGKKHCRLSCPRVFPDQFRCNRFKKKTTPVPIRTTRKKNWRCENVETGEFDSSIAYLTRVECEYWCISTYENHAHCLKIRPR